MRTYVCYENYKDNFFVNTLPNPEQSLLHTKQKQILDNILSAQSNFQKSMDGLKVLSLQRCVIQEKTKEKFIIKRNG